MKVHLPKNLRTVTKNGYGSGNVREFRVNSLRNRVTAPCTRTFDQVVSNEFIKAICKRLPVHIPPLTKIVNKSYMHYAATAATAQAEISIL